MLRECVRCGAQFQGDWGSVCPMCQSVNNYTLPDMGGLRPDGLDSPGRKLLETLQEQAEDHIQHPQHYTTHPSGVECIQITEHMNFCLGNAIKYIWRHDQKGGVDDLKKAKFYLEREIARLEG